MSRRCVEAICDGTHLDFIVSNSGTKLSARRVKDRRDLHHQDPPCAGHYCDVCKYVYHLCCCVPRTQKPQPTPVLLPPFYREAIFTGDFLDMSSIKTAALPHPQTVVLCSFCRAAHPLLLLRRDGPRLRSPPSAVFSGKSVCRPAEPVTCVLLYL